MRVNPGRIGSVALTVLALLGLAACGSSSSSNATTSSSSSSTPATSSSSTSTSTSPTTGSGSTTINGAGSTFANPIYMQWAQNLSSQGLTVNYNAVGSGAGIAGLQSSTIDFAGSDPAEKPSEIAAGKGPVLQFPIGFGAITVSYNLPGVKSGLKLDGKTLGDIYLGKVKKWDDPEIKALNQGVSLPSMPITVVHRTDSSGTTKGFTTFLSDYSSAWTAAAGKPNKTVNWPTGTGAPKNAGVAAAIKQTPGAIGYVEQAYALQNNFAYAAMKNSSGAFVVPTLAATSAAAAGAKIPADLTVSTINSSGATAYPITSQTFEIVYKDTCKAGRSPASASGVKKLLTYALGPGQMVEKQLYYAPLPAALLAKDMAQLTQLSCNGSPVS
ncbi:MAG: phosphate ABC transporter substrate-binding protein PstS [Actinomycetota bacterium]|nr:phosphate ABC transporter substrate-binding protein PstS [Actinomycetota bacterium]